VDTAIHGLVSKESWCQNNSLEPSHLLLEKTSFTVAHLGSYLASLNTKQIT
jgi:hypothetical protein